MSASGDIDLGRDFFLGSTTSAVQCEGGGIDNDFTRWAATHPGWAQANPGLDHWNRLDDDYAHLARNNHSAHGLTVDWARIEPQDGVIDHAALQHYRDEIRICRAHGMEPMVTLLQYALPTWLAARGGVLAPDAVDRFAKFARLCAEELGDGVTWWNTMNEPNSLAAAGYLVGVWPPGQTSVFQMSRAFDAMLRMHAAAAAAVHDVAARNHRTAKVSVAYISDGHRPWQWWNPLDRTAARLYEYGANRWFLDSIAAGRSLWPIGNGDEIPGLRGSLDYLGLNFYGRSWDHVSPKGGRWGSPVVSKPDPDPHPPGVDADGLYATVLRLWNSYQLPLMITENGVDIPEPDSANARGRAIIDFLSALNHAQRDGVPVLGYLHWTDWDSPEWQDGYTQHYGLFGFDPATGRRWNKPAAATYAEICARRGIPATWLSAINRQSPAQRDREAAHQLRALLRAQRQHGVARRPRAATQLS